MLGVYSEALQRICLSNLTCSGRVKSLKGFVDWKDIDLGAEFIHGEKSALKALVDKNVFNLQLHNFYAFKFNLIHFNLQLIYNSFVTSLINS